MTLSFPFAVRISLASNLDNTSSHQPFLLEYSVKLSDLTSPASENLAKKDDNKHQHLLLPQPNEQDQHDQLLEFQLLLGRLRDSYYNSLSPFLLSCLVSASSPSPKEVVEEENENDNTLSQSLSLLKMNVMAFATWLPFLALHLSHPRHPILAASLQAWQWLLSSSGTSIYKNLEEGGEDFASSQEALKDFYGLPTSSFSSFSFETGNSRLLMAGKEEMTADTLPPTYP